MLVKEMKMNAEVKAERLDSLLDTIEQMTFKLRDKISFGNLTPNQVSEALGKIARLTRIANDFQAEYIDMRLLDKVLYEVLVELVELTEGY